MHNATKKSQSSDKDKALTSNLILSFLDRKQFQPQINVPYIQLYKMSNLSFFLYPKHVIHCVYIGETIFPPMMKILGIVIQT